MKRVWLLLSIILLTLFAQGCTMSNSSETVPKKQTAAFIPPTRYSDQTQQVNELAGFVQAQLVTSKGIYSQNEVEGKSNTWLSESSGLWLTYLAETGQYKEFRQVYQQTLKSFDNEGILMYRIDTDTRDRSDVNATLDDLRVIRSLGLYAAKTNSTRYQKIAMERFDKLWQKVGSGDHLRDFYDVESRQTSPITSLAYYDLLTLKTFESCRAGGKNRYQKQLQFVKNGFLRNNLPLYAVNFNWTDKRYSKKSLNTSEALLTLLHLAEVHQIRSDSLEWLRQRVNAAKLYNGYNVKGGVTDWGQSAANYAIAARIFAVTKHRGLYNQAMNQVWRFQLKDSGSKLSGSLGDSKRHVSYAFNNLQALESSTY